MAYKIEKKVLTLVLEDLGGADVVCRKSLSLGEMLAMRDLSVTEDGVREAYLRFATDVLVSWNIEDDDGRIPATFEGMLRIPSEIATAIMAAWGDQLTAVPTTSATA